MNRVISTITVALLVIAALFFAIGNKSRVVPPLKPQPTNETSVQNSPLPQNSSPKNLPVKTSQPSRSPTTETLAPSQGLVCNTALIASDGLDKYRVITKEACDLVNTLYAEGKAAGNLGDTYENRDGLHVNFCEDWTPNPDCPAQYRFFSQHLWLLSGGVGRATDTRSGVTIGQASYAGETSGYLKHSIPYSMYKTASGADILYNQYTHNNLYIYPSLEESAKDNIANTPYVISSEDIVKDSDGTYFIHNSSGSDLPFVKIAILGLAALTPDVKKALKDSAFLMPTLQMLIRHAHRSVGSESEYLSEVVHSDVFHANYLSGGLSQPTYDSLKLVRMASGLTISEIPPLVRLKIISEDFSSNEKLFNTPGALARAIALGALSRTIKVSAGDSVDINGNHVGFIYEWKILKGDSSKVKITKSALDPAVATLEFIGGSVGERLDVGVFVKKPNSKYYSVPGIISVYVHS